MDRKELVKRDKDRLTDTQLAFGLATWFPCKALGKDAHGLGIPVGIAACSIEHYILEGLREHNWPLTRYSLAVAQMRSAEESTKLWTEENA